MFDVPVRLCRSHLVAVRTGCADCMQRGVDLGWIRGIRMCAVAAWITRPESGGSAPWGGGHYGVRCSLGDGCGGRCAAVQWPNLTAQQTDFRRKSNPDRVARVEKSKIGCIPS